MKIIKASSLIAACFLIAAPSSVYGDDEQVKDPAGKTLAEAMAAVQSANGNTEQLNNNLYKAYTAAFQMGDFDLAMQTLGGAVANGYTLSLWDQAALAEMFARQGKYDLAKKRIDFAMEGFKEGKCDYDSKWKDFSKALEKNDISTVKTMVASAEPALVNTYPSTDAKHRRGVVKFTSYDESYPKEVPVTLVVSDKGKVECASLAEGYQEYSVMLTALKQQKFKPAEVNGEKIWQYGYSFVITHEIGKNDLEMDLTGGGQGAGNATFGR